MSASRFPFTSPALSVGHAAAVWLPRLVVALIAVALVANVLAVVRGTPPEVAAVAGAPADDIVALVGPSASGDGATLGRWTVSPEEAGASDAFGVDERSAVSADGMRWLFVPVTVTNNGDEHADLAIRFQLQAAGGDWYEGTTGVALSGLVDRASIAPGEDRVGLVAFWMPIGEPGSCVLRATAIGSGEDEATADWFVCPAQAAAAEQDRSPAPPGKL